MYGPVSGRENDVDVLNLSGLNAHLMALQPEIAAARDVENKKYYISLFTAILFFPCLNALLALIDPPYVEN